MKTLTNIADLLGNNRLNDTITSEKDSLQLSGKVFDIPLDEIEFDPEQPRQEIIEEEVVDIVATLRAPGSKINQPVTVWPKNADGLYILKFGEKRTRASRLANRETIPAIIDDRYEWDNEEHRAINFAEQYIENQRRGGLTPLDDCLALAKLKKTLGSLEKVKLFTGEKSLGTISDKIKVAEIASNERYKFLHDFYLSKQLTDLTILNGLIKVLKKRSEHFDSIKLRIENAVGEGVLNRKWIAALNTYNFSDEGELSTSSQNETMKRVSTNTSKGPKNKEDLPYIARPAKKAKLFATHTVGRKRVRCELLLDRADKEEGYVWIISEGNDEPERVSLSKVTLTELK